MVRMKGLEPSRLSALVPKTSVSTIPPHPRGVCNGVILLDMPKKDQLGITVVLLANCLEAW